METLFEQSHAELIESVNSADAKMSPQHAAKRVNVYFSSLAVERGLFAYVHCIHKHSTQFPFAAQFVCKAFPLRYHVSFQTESGRGEPHFLKCNVFIGIFVHSHSLIGLDFNNTIWYCNGKVPMLSI